MATITSTSSIDPAYDQDWLVNQIAHALRNPIFAALVQSEALSLKAGDDESIARSALMIQKQLKRLEGNLQEMLLLGRPPRLNIRTMDLGIVMTGVVEAARQGARGEPAEVLFGPDISAPEMASDSDAIRIIAERLLDNAVEHTEPPHEIEVSIDQPTLDSVRISVRDAGEGIAEEILERVFQPFFPQHGGRPGLGLSVAAKYTHVLGGHIEIDSSPDEGTVAHCILPVHATPVES